MTSTERRILIVLAVLLLGGGLVRLLPKRPQQTDTATVLSVSRIDINTAPALELMRLPGIGRLTAQRIVEFRSQNGPFKDPADIMNVKGIGEKKFDAIKELILP